MKHKRMFALLSALFLVTSAGIAHADQLRADGDALAAGLQSGNPATVTLGPGQTHTFKVAAHVFENGNAHVTFPVTVAVTKNAAFLSPDKASGNITGYDSAGQLPVDVTATAPAAADLTCGVTTRLSGKVIFTATSSDDLSALGTNGTNAEVVLSINVTGPACSDPGPGTPADTTDPVISGMPAATTAEATGPSGAAVSWTAPTATDDTDGSVDVICDPASGSTFAIGVTTVTCTATDAAGNEASATFDVTVEDTTGPELDLPDDMALSASSNSQATGTYTATSSDLVDGDVAVSCTPESGSSFPIGPTTVNCSATDAAGNPSNGSFTVTVSYSWTGFFRPVDNLPALNVAKAGSSIPIKFSLSGNQGLGILASGSPTSKRSDCAAAGAPDTIEETATAGQSTLSYDAIADQYNYVWKTEKSWAGTCRTLTVMLADGKIKQALFKLTK